MPHYKLIGLLLWLIAFALVGWVLSQMPLDSIAQTMAALTWTDWLAWSGINLAVILISTARWRVLTKMLQLPVTFLQLLLIRQAGQTVSFITPGPQFGGEPLQIYWLYKRFGIAVHSAVLALGLDRFYELWINFAVLILGVLLLLTSVAAMPALSESANWLEILSILLMVVLIMTLIGWALLRRPQWISQRTERLAQRWLQSPRLQKIDDHWQALGSDLQSAVRTQKFALLRAFVLSLLTWGCIVSEMILVLHILDIDVTMSGVILILVATRLALLLPLPGGIGTLEASLLWSFQSLGLPTTAAVGVIALMRLRDAIVLVAGLLCLRAMQTRG
ncbi:MAG: lysylphosphatidylglycerol synthase transmembrane domain-containing protein [Pseudohongiellaceae bacterium]